MHSFAELSGMMPAEGKFVLTTVDTIFRREDFARYVARFETEEGIDALMAVTSHIDDEKPLYVATDAEMRVTQFSDTAAEDIHFVSGGIYGLTPPALGVLHRCLHDGVSRMRNFQRRLLTDGLRVKAYDMGTILDVDHASDISKADNFLSEEKE